MPLHTHRHTPMHTHMHTHIHTPRTHRDKPVEALDVRGHEELSHVLCVVCARTDARSQRQLDRQPIPHLAPAPPATRLVL
eukprot:3515268-Rhodomonas_salina.1